MNSPYAKKSLGQHWLHDSAALSAMASAADVKEGDTVLEIGPGTGTLTTVLLQRGARVIAVELDQDRIPELRRDFKDAAFEVHEESILEFDLTQLPPDYKLVANIPYYLTSHLIRILSESKNRPTVATLLVQKEVAERVSATPGSMSLLSVSAQYYWEVSMDMVVPARLFTPPPKVDSQVLVMKRRDTPLFDVDEKLFFQIVKAGYSNRRKKVSNSLAGGLRITKPAATELLVTAGLSPDVRAQELSLEDWHQLYQAYYPTNVSE
ncbi:MAG: putative Ribosomal small subunit methyltransferase [Candidatus Saccharibacteria bacterium]|nr:putative Ribosomal small subunit methyltransferase [Candidatus Saccharibacteria bacterium]